MGFFTRRKIEPNEEGFYSIKADEYIHCFYTCYLDGTETHEFYTYSTFDKIVQWFKDKWDHLFY